jgi:hypothetical protein
MKTLIATLAATAALAAVAAPVAAQPYRGYDRYEQGRYEQDRYDHGRWYTSERVRTDERRIESGLRNGELRPREAARLRAEVRDYARLEARYRANGLSPWERYELDQRHKALIAEMNRVLYGPRYYGEGYGRHW